MKISHLLIAGLMSVAAFGATVARAADEFITIQLKDGPVVIKMMPDVAPNHVKRIEELATKGEYDNVAFHRVIEGFMAQTGDVKFGNMSKDFKPDMAGMGGSSLPDLKAEFSSVPFERGVVGMARSSDPDSANSQFFIMFAPAPNLDGQYTVVGKVVSGMEFVDKIKRGDPAGNGVVTDPDRMIKVTVGKP
jgi:cyclophilin family peptidyl-prolyl cis-trans isomerase